MKRKHKEAWLAALRSGDYVQGTGTLRLDGPNGEARHCCLGVLVEVVRYQFPEVLQELDLLVEDREADSDGPGTLILRYPNEHDPSGRTDERNELPPPLRRLDLGAHRHRASPDRSRAREVIGVGRKRNRVAESAATLIAARIVGCDHCANRATRLLVKGPEAMGLCDECGKESGATFIPEVCRG